MPDEEQILAAYQTTVKQGGGWLLVRYETTSGNWVHCATGNQGAESMRDAITDSDICLIFYHGNVGGRIPLAPILYIPPSTAGIDQARCMGRVRVLCDALHIDHSPWIVERPEAVISYARRSASESPELAEGRLQALNMQRSASTQPNRSKPLPGYVAPSRVKRAKSENVFTRYVDGLLRKKRKKAVQAPDVTPPLPAIPDKECPRFPSPTTTSMMQPAVDEMTASPPTSPKSDYQPNLYGTYKERKYISHVRDPTERARLRAEAEAQRREEEKRALMEERERQASLKASKQEILKQAEEDEARRKAIVAEELRQVASRKLREEQEEAEAEEQRRQEIEERKRAERERTKKRAEDAREQGKDPTGKTDDAFRREAEVQARQNRVIWARRAEARWKQGTRSSEQMILSGYLSVQTNESLTWKRRFFVLSDKNLKLYYNKDPKDKDTPTDIITLSTIGGIKEWSEGFEELRTIPNSFAIEFRDGQGPFLIYSDTPAEKELLVGLLCVHLNRNGQSYTQQSGYGQGKKAGWFS